MRQKVLIILAVIMLCATYSNAQTDFWGHMYTENNYQASLKVYCDGGCYQSQYIKLSGIFTNLKTKETELDLEVYKVGCKDYIHVPITKRSVIKCCNRELTIKTCGGTSSYFSDNKWGWNVRDGQKITIIAIFDGILPLNSTICEVILDTYYGNCDFANIQWKGLNDETVRRYYGYNHTTNWTETSIKEFADANNDGICGIYGTQTVKYGCIKEDGLYKLIWLGTASNRCAWNIGDLQAVLHPTGAENTYKADYIESDFTLSNTKYVSFDGKEMKIGYAQSAKIYPPVVINDNISGGNNKNNNSGSNSPDNFAGGWSGSGFALNKGYLATNYHVIEGASVIKVFGVKGNFNIGYNAQVVITDKVNDLAVLKINDTRFQGFGAIPYRVKTTMAEVGESVFVLGYPLTTTMGSEVKLTTGVISARSGFQGDVSLYQVSAPIQPGNSGGPCFDNNGNLVGIINSKHRGAENVSYAIKSSYLQNLVESSDVSGLLPQNNTISSYALQGKVKSVKNFVYYIRCK